MVFPGIGQFVQKRWIAGLLFSTLFLGTFIFFCVVAFGLIADYYRMGFEFETYEPHPIHLKHLLYPFGLAMLIYTLNVIDTAIAHFRLCQKNTQKPLP
jgi:hypothetical protein